MTHLNIPVPYYCFEAKHYPFWLPCWYQGEIRVPPPFRRDRDQLIFLGIGRSELGWVVTRIRPAVSTVIATRNVEALG